MQQNNGPSFPRQPGPYKWRGNIRRKVQQMPPPSGILNTNITTTALNTSVSFPSATINAGSGVTTSVLNTSVSFPSPTIATMTNIVTSAFNTSVSFPSPTIAFNGVVAVNVTTITGSNTGTIPSTTAGNTLIVAFAGSGGAGSVNAVNVTGMTLGSANLYRAFEQDDGASASASCSAVWYLPNIAGGQTSVTVSGNNLNSADSYFTVYEVWNLGNSPLVDQTSAGPLKAGTTTFTSNATATLSTPIEFAVGITAHGPNSATDTLAVTASGWNANPDFVWADGSAISGSQVTASTAALTYSGTSVDFDYYTCVVITFAPTGTLSLPSIPPQPGGSTWRRFNRRIQQQMPANGQLQATNANITTTVLTTSVSFDTNDVNAGEVITTSALNTSVSFPAVTINAGEVITTSALNTSVSFPSVVINAGEVITASDGGMCSVSFPAVSIIATTPFVVGILPQPGGQTWRRFNRRVQQMPPANGAVNCNIIPVTFTTSVSFDTNDVNAGEVITTTAFNGSVSFPSVTINAGEVITASDGGMCSVAFPAVQINASETITASDGGMCSVAFPPLGIINTTPFVVGIQPQPGGLTWRRFNRRVQQIMPANGVVNCNIIASDGNMCSVAFPSPTITAGGSANITTTALNCSVSFPTVQINAGEVATTSALDCSVSFPAVTINAGSVITASDNGMCSVAFPACTINAGEVITASDNGMCSVAFPSVTVNAGSVIIATDNGMCSVAFPAVVVNASETITTTVLTGTVAFPPLGIINTTPFVVGMVPQYGGKTWRWFNRRPQQLMPANGVVNCNIIASDNGMCSVSFPAPSISAGGNATITPSTLDTSVSFPALQINAGEVATTTVLNTTVSFPAVTINAGSVITTSVLSGSVAFPSVTINAGEVITTSVLTTSVSFPSLTVNAGEVITTSVLTTSVAFPAPTITANANANITTSVFNGTVAFPALTVNAGSVVTTTVLTGSVSFPTVTITVSAVIIPNSLLTSVSFPAVTISTTTNANIGTTVFTTSVTFPLPSIQSLTILPIPDNLLAGSVGYPVIGGSVSVPIIGGTASLAIVEGSANPTIDNYGVSVAENPLGGSASISTIIEIGTISTTLISGSASTPISVSIGTVAFPNYAGEGSDSQMALMINLSGYENNDSTFNLQVTENNYPLSLSGLTPTIVVKANATATDGSGTTYGVGTGITIVNSLLGTLTWVLPHSATGTTGTFWWRLNLTATSGGAVTTALFGNLYILPV
jgi:hypothetical protein